MAFEKATACIKWELLFLFLFLLVSLFLVSACTNGKTQSLEAFYKDAKIENIDKVIIHFDSKRKFKFTLSEIDNTYYDSNPDIHPIVENYYKQLGIVEE
ncbi:hypothetical protein [Lysinibacillus sp. RC79]|uniref:hypothetical protein n=1 Tax=Lysinibacillus sp. RC79 TaxID=3156296 RepID=UPI0035172B3F